MSILTYPLGFIGGGVTDFYNGVMENGLRNNVGDGSYMRRTQTDGNSQTLTHSFWVKAAKNAGMTVIAYTQGNKNVSLQWADYEIDDFNIK